MFTPTWTEKQIIITPIQKKIKQLVLIYVGKKVKRAGLWISEGADARNWQKMDGRDCVINHFKTSKTDLGYEVFIGTHKYIFREIMNVY